MSDCHWRFTANCYRCLWNGIVNVCNLNHSDVFFGELPPRPRCAHQSAWQINEPEEVGSQWNLTELYVWHSRWRSDEIRSVNRHLESHLSGKKSQHEWIHMQVHRFDISALTLGRKRQMGLEFYIILLLSYRLLNLHL